jgi:HK97 family phage major capsid protein
MGTDMFTSEQINTRLKTLSADTDAALSDFTAGKITQKRFDDVMALAEIESTKLKTMAETRGKAMRYASGADAVPYGKGIDPGMDVAGMHQTASKGYLDDAGHNPYATHISDVSSADWQNLYGAAQAKIPFELKAQSKAMTAKVMADGGNVVNKTPLFNVEGAGGSLLPPELIPSAFPIRYEPDRAWSHFPGMPMTTQQVAYLQHTGNTNPAAVTAEAATLPDLGMVIVEKTATAIKLGATAAWTREILDDYESFMGFVPDEMSKALVDAETNYVVNNATAGILSTSGILTRNAAATWPAGSATPIDAVVAGMNDIRVGSSFCKANLILMHPTTWLNLRQQRTSIGSYVLDQWQPNLTLGESLDNLFGVRVCQNTYVPLGTAIVMDTTSAVIAFQRMGIELAVNWQGDSVFATFAYQWRVVERIALAIPRPSAICAVINLPSYSSGGS